MHVESPCPRCGLTQVFRAEYRDPGMSFAMSHWLTFFRWKASTCQCHPVDSPYRDLVIADERAVADQLERLYADGKLRLTDAEVRF